MRLAFKIGIAGEMRESLPALKISVTCGCLELRCNMLVIDHDVLIVPTPSCRH